MPKASYFGVSAYLKEKVKELSEEAEKILEDLGFGDSFLSGLFEYLIYRKK